MLTDVLGNLHVLGRKDWGVRREETCPLGGGVGHAATRVGRRTDEGKERSNAAWQAHGEHHVVQEWRFT